MAHRGPTVRATRRRFVTFLGSAAAAYPFSASAQGPSGCDGSAYSSAFQSPTPKSPPQVEAFQRELDKLGWTQDRNVQIVYRWAGVDADRIRNFAAELVAISPDVVVAHPTLAAEALARETRTIPIVFTLVSDPVGSALTASIARPSGNATGFTNFAPSMGGKWIEMLKAISPQIKQVRTPVQSRNSPGSRINLPTACRSCRLILGGGANHCSSPQRCRDRRCTCRTREQ